MIRGIGRPTNGYYLADGTRVPGSTTVTGRGKDSGGLVFVAKRNWHEAGRLGKPFDRDAYWSDGDALQAGTLVHDWIEADIHTPGGAIRSYPDEASQLTKQQADIGFSAYKQWRTAVNLEILETEVPLVSEVYGYGGTLDAIALVNGERCIFDWKTSNGTYPDYIAQVAAYRQLVNEVYVGVFDWEPIKSAHLLRVDKEFGSFHHHWWPEAVLDIGWTWFLAAKELYDADKRLKKVAS